MPASSIGRSRLGEKAEQRHSSVLLSIFSCFLLLLPGQLGAAAPDLTQTDLSTIDRTYTYNLGPTGMRGWIYKNTTANAGQQGLMTAASPWQILVTTVGANTPASGIMAGNDVILGVSAGAGNVPVPFFTNDCRKSLGWAIGAAEAGDGVLNLKRWRAGVTTDVSLQLLVLGPYSPTAPYDCPKSARILSNACNVIANQSFPGVPGGPVLGLALLASGNASYLPKVRTYAYSLAPANLALRFAPGQQTTSADVWGWGYKGVFLAEYYLLTGDTNVLHGVNEYAVALAQAQSRYGTMCHGGALLNADGSFHGTVPPYGPVNQGALSANLAIVLGKKCLLASGSPVDPEIDPAIDRAAKFFGFYVQKGNIPYGEHEPWFYHAGNGKESLATLLFAMMGDKPVETEYWTRMTLAGFNGREYGHTGQGFSYLWGAMAANVGGTNALAAYLAQVRWHLDLERRCDGSFVYDGGEQYGGSAVSDYWGASSYYGIDPTATYVLAYALPKQQLYLTGKNANPANSLSSDKLTNALWAGIFDQVCTGYNTNQLLAALGEYDPLVRSWAAAELGTRANVSVPLLIALAGNPTNALLREAACHALGVLKNTSALSVLGQRLTDPDVWVRAQAATALRNFGSAASSQLTTMLMAFTNNATAPDAVEWSDPVQIANGHLSFALFGDAVYGGNNLATYSINASKNLLYPAVEAGLKQPDSNPRFGVANFACNYLTLADVKALLPTLFEVAAVECQADTMWSMDPRAKAIDTLAKFKVAEAIPLALAMQLTPTGFGWNDNGFKVPALNALAAYGDSARWTLPTLKSYLATWDTTSTEYTTLNSTIASISSAAAPAGITNLFPVANSQVVATTNARAIALTGFSWRTNAVAFTNLTAPAHGTLTGTAPNLVYTPAPNYSGPDRFTFQVLDGVTNSDPATVSIIVGPAGTGLQGAYYDNVDFTNLKFTRTDPQINFDWGTGAPSNSMVADTFSVGWNGLLLAPETGTYLFSTLNSDGVRFYVNGALLIDDFVDQVTGWTDSAPLTLTAGQTYEVQMDYYENTGSAVAKLKWTGPSFAGSNGVLIAKEWLYDGSTLSNRIPFAYAQSVTMLQNSSKALTLTGSGANLGSLVYSIVTPPAHGLLSGTLPTVTYTPAANYTGADSFTFLVNNGASNSAPAAVSIAILAGSPVSFFWTNIASGSWSRAANWTNAAGMTGAPNATGQPFYALNFNRSGTYSVTNDLNSGFLFNQLNVAGTVTFAGANSLSPTANGPLLPQLNQNSVNPVAFTVPLNLAAMTLLGGTGGGQVTLSGLVSGAGGLTKNSPGILQINNVENTYSGGTVISGGTVSLGLQAHRALGVGPVTLNAGGTLTLERVNATNALTLNGGTINANNGFGDSFNGPVTLNSNTTINATYNMGFAGNISGAGGFTKGGKNTLTLSGINSATGPNIVTAGTLACTRSGALGSGPLSISDGATVNLNYTGTRNVATLTLGGVNHPVGTYGSTSSPATHKDSHFTGTGTITVLATVTPPTPVLPPGALLISDGVPVFSFDTAAGFEYRLVYKNDLAETAWQAVIAPPNFPAPNGWSIASTGEPMSLSDTSAAGQPQRFYRLEAAVSE